MRLAYISASAHSIVSISSDVLLNLPLLGSYFCVAVRVAADLVFPAGSTQDIQFQFMFPFAPTPVWRCFQFRPPPFFSLLGIPVLVFHISTLYSVFVPGGMSDTFPPPCNSSFTNTIALSNDVKAVSLSWEVRTAFS